MDETFVVSFVPFVRHRCACSVSYHFVDGCSFQQFSSLDDEDEDDDEESLESESDDFDPDSDELEEEEEDDDEESDVLFIGRAWLLESEGRL